MGAPERFGFKKHNPKFRHHQESPSNHSNIHFGCFFWQKFCRGYPSFGIAQSSCQQSRILLEDHAQLRHHFAWEGHIIWPPWFFGENSLGLSWLLTFENHSAELPTHLNTPWIPHTVEGPFSITGSHGLATILDFGQKLCGPIAAFGIAPLSCLPTRILICFNPDNSTGLVPRLAELRTAGFLIISFLFGLSRPSFSHVELHRQQQKTMQSVQLYPSPLFFWSSVTNRYIN